MLLWQLNGPLRIAFQVHIGRIALQACQCKHLVHHLEDQHILPEGEAFGHGRFYMVKTSKNKSTKKSAGYLVSLQPGCQLMK
jgi:hypothetical protein